MDLDELLSLEEQFYKDGYEQGKQEIILETVKSGQMLGIQTGYQRLFLIGLVLGFLETIAKSGPEEFKRYRGKLKVEDIDVDQLLSNEDESIAKLDKLIKKSRNWIQMNNHSSTNATDGQNTVKIPKMSVIDEIVFRITGMKLNTALNNLEDW